MAQKDLIQVYTESNKLIANDVVASCRTENDPSHIYVPILALFAKVFEKLP